ncbi:Heavy-metal resistance [Novosphingobium sp. CF614]|uniref:Spy/CpxP family protein refolding chaperone n=1 Tax=Novosphingobium sp. CF614 TaxID=1884364 RepID=UPI0008F00A0B|nr:periplasmic heavy metal sensor [Novosphingobium sp. CF614]SFG11560.1 Heavy-metal resistance [Novosphingobium sp. CF614]
MRGLARYALVALVAFLVALVAARAGQGLFHADTSTGRLHALMHEKLDLDPGQERQIARLEADFAARRKSLDAELQAANADLAVAITHEHQYGPAAEKAVDRSHHAMGELQKATLRHVFAMRAVLRPDQARQFDQAVAGALTSRPKE